MYFKRILIKNMGVYLILCGEKDWLERKGEIFYLMINVLIFLDIYLYDNFFLN